ncbi:MAG: prolyl oligopeptidase family serine peptidase [Ignavibacterium sp.]|jgi:pimeloyl-ACP methyl ester carboxylesterase|nr:prolyl oligopeptidase family serine peptidase [Ignavibacterium sp.]
MNKDFRLKTKEGEFLNISSFGLDNIKSSPCIILVHGFKGFKDWGFFPYAAKYFADKGFFVLSFNFSHNGIDDQGSDFNRLDKFAENTVSLEVSELVQVISAYKNGFFEHKVFNRICLVGHSRGAGVALLSSLIDKVDAYIIWASVEKFDRYTKRQKAEWRKQGFVEVINSRTNQMMRMNVESLEDIETNKDGSLSIEKAVKSLEKPLLIIHGEQDLTVPVTEGEKIFKWSDKTLTQFEKVVACGHTFDIVHPFEGSNKKFDLLISKTEDFLTKLFKV